MKLKLTLRRSGGASTDIVVTTDAAASVGDVAGAIATLDPFRRTAPPPAPVLRVLDEASGTDRAVDPELSLGEAPLGSGATVMVGAADDGKQQKPAVLAELVITEGPGAGGRLALSPGTHHLGRDASLADLVLTDPLVSKRHARVDAVPGLVRIVDLNSANGLEIDGGLVPRVDLSDGESVRLGDTVLTASVPKAAGAAPEPTGTVPFNRSPRVESRYPGREYPAPTMPTEKDKQPFPWVAMAAPLVLGVVFFAFGRGIESLIFIAASPLIMLGTYFSTRAMRRRKEKLDIQRFEERTGHLDQTLEAEVPVERSTRKQENPSTAEVLAAAKELGPLLWTRRPEHWQFLSLNLGVGTMESRNVVAMSNEESALPQYLDRVLALQKKYRTISDVPVTENLFFAGALGVAGRHSAAADVARGIVVQATGLHSPAELVVAAIVSPAWTPEFEWLKWLPHTASPHSPIEAGHLANSPTTGAALLSSIEELVRSRAKAAEERGATMLAKSALVAGASAGEQGGVASPPPAPTPAVLLLISDDAPVDRARIVQLAEAAADAGVYPLWVAPTVAGLPAVARTFVDVADDARTAKVGLVRLGTELVEVLAEPVKRDEALDYAKRLAPVVDAGAMLADASDLPRSVSLLSLIGPELAANPDAAVERWVQNESVHDRSGVLTPRRRSGRLRAIVGQSGADAMHLDLRTQGPHALVGGTTGSGKSEFLQGWVLGMAAEYSPDRVTFLFVDYKGGSAFADCVNLPHCVGLVTDLSPHLVRRALTSLRAELRHREHLFNRKKAKDLLELEKRGDPDAPPALVIVIDEFAALAGEVPEFVDGVVDVAQRGRSLGIHLIMATQRPAGVIRDNLRANTNLRIALRMADEADSLDVVGDASASAFDPTIPGRAVAKTGPGRLTGFQSAYAGGWTSDVPAAPSVEVAELRFGAEQPWESADADAAGVVEESGPTDQSRLVANLIAAARAASVPAPRRPWLDELAPAFDLTRLRQRTDTELVVGVMDVPEEQRQDEVYFRPDTDGNIAVFGAGGSGKTVTLRTLAASAGITPRGGPVDVYGMDFATGGLRMLEVLPHVGSVVSGDDPDRVIRLLRTLRDELEDRRARYSAVNAGGIVDYRRIANAPDERRILLLLDNYPAFRSEFEAVSGRAVWYGVFLQLLSEGRGLGIHVALTADRGGSVPTAVSSTVQRRIVHRLADESGYLLMDLPDDVIGVNSPPGRALVDGLETQIAIVGGKPGVVEQSAALAALAAAIERTGRAPAPTIGTLGTEIAASSLPDAVGGLPVLGISDDDLQPVGFDPSGAMLLAGPPASGRTNALRALARALDRGVPGVQRYYLGNARSPIAADPGWAGTATTVEAVAELAKALTTRVGDPKTTGRVAIVVEQLADFLSGPADAPLVELFRAIKRSEHFVLAESETSTWSSSYPLLGEIKSARTGFLLQPDGIEGDTILRTAIPRVSRGEFPPGRGYLVARGKAQRVQLPLAEL